jgi:methionyl-tRNA formyltransferase
MQRAVVEGLNPGELRVAKREVLVGTATEAVRLGEITAPGKRAMAAADWARGARPEPGERFE